FKKRYEKVENREKSKKKDGPLSNNHSLISKQDVFHYTYAVLHPPAYRAKYEINLKREFPRLPFYEDFRQWAEWGKALMDLHLGYEQAAAFPLERHDRKEPANTQADEPSDKPKLK